MKEPAEYLKFMWPMRTFLVTCGETRDRPNIIAVSFCMPVSRKPPLLACAIGKETHSSGLIDRYGEFIVNVPTAEVWRKVFFCGSHSGATVDKFEETGFTPRRGLKVMAPIIEECVAHMECRLKERVETGEKYLYIGEVVEAYADNDVLSGEREVEYHYGEFPGQVYSIRFG